MITETLRSSSFYLPFHPENQEIQDHPSLCYTRLLNLSSSHPSRIVLSLVVRKGNLAKAFIFLCGSVLAVPRKKYQGHMILGLRKSHSNKKEGLNQIKENMRKKKGGREKRVVISCQKKLKTILYLAQLVK